MRLILQQLLDAHDKQEQTNPPAIFPKLIALARKYTVQLVLYDDKSPLITLACQCTMQLILYDDKSPLINLACHCTVSVGTMYPS